MDLWGYTREAIERAVRQVEPETARVDALTTGLWVYVTLRDGTSRTVPESRLERCFTCADLKR